jgi:hypothetical protein
VGTKAKWLKGKLTFYNNAVVEENVSTSYTSTNATIPPYGLRILNPTTSAKFIVDGGPAIGAELQLVCLSTYTTFVRVSTQDSTNGGETIVRPGTCEAYAVGLHAASSDRGGMPGMVTLRGITTSVWAVVGASLSSGPLGGGTTGGGYYLSTAFA